LPLFGGLAKWKKFPPTSAKLDFCRLLAKPILAGFLADLQLLLFAAICLLATLAPSCSLSAGVDNEPRNIDCKKFCLRNNCPLNAPFNAPVCCGYSIF
jgi:hypothetical protein